MAGLFADEPPSGAAPAGPTLFGDTLPAGEPPAAAQAAAYRVLARKYRPTRLADLIGQEGLVRTLRNAFAMQRIAHAFMLTGVRGVGKTTTARILARALNCTGPDGAGGPTAEPCGVCENCIAILADRHPDVVEMDAASNTGVDDVREIIEATRFRPLVARIKVFIIDEVHMLSRNAFNALLKTLEEPPPHVKFIFATTEIRKVPVTVLSRCQRFDLRRVPVAELSTHFGRIAAAEGIAIAAEALDHIARAADGSVRDGLSLLDQAIARGAEEGGEISGLMVAEMLGLADRGLVFDLLASIIAGDAAAALAITDTAYLQGADLGVVLADLLALAHLLTRLKSVPQLGLGNALPEIDRKQGTKLAGQLPVPWLGRLWQMLLKGVAEVEQAPDRRAAAEMIVIRLCHVADLPPPAELLRELQARNGENPPPETTASRVRPGAPNNAARSLGAAALAALPREVPLSDAPLPDAPPPRPIGFGDVVALAQARHEVMLYAHLRQSVHLVRFAPPVIEMRLAPGAPRDLVPRLAALLEAETGRRWTLALSQAEGAPTLDAVEQQADRSALMAAHDHPLVQAILATFPGARVESRRPPEQVAEPPDWAELEPSEQAYDEEE